MSKNDPDDTPNSRRLIGVRLKIELQYMCDVI